MVGGTSESDERRRRVRLRAWRASTAKVLQACTRPEFIPVVNQRTHSEEPWVRCQVDVSLRPLLDVVV